MRTLLLGNDFMYKSNGTLVPIEINTNIILDAVIPNDDNIVFDFTTLSNFITNNGFTKLIYIGSLRTLFQNKITEMCNSLNIVYEWVTVEPESITIPYVEDNDTTLIIRSAYDTTAIVDDVYCKNKVNFLNLIKNQTFGSQFAYMDDYGVLVNNITTIPDNGNHPNFILKSVLPKYDKINYPKLYKVSNQDELNIILQNVNEDYYLSEFHYNSSKLISDHITVIRSFNLLFPPNLNSMTIGQYHRLTPKLLDNDSIYDINTFELAKADKDKYITLGGNLNTPKLLDTDMVEMADGTFKSALDLQIGDYVKTLDIPNPEGINLSNDSGNFKITYDLFLSGTTYKSNKVTDKKRAEQFVKYAKILFTDNTDWEDTTTSSYLVYKNNEVRFIRIGELVEGDQIILVNFSNSEFTSTLKTVSSISVLTNVFSGWLIVVEEKHIFLTKNDVSDVESYAAIEHNSVSCTYPTKYNTCWGASCSWGYCQAYAYNSCWCS